MQIKKIVFPQVWEDEKCFPLNQMWKQPSEWSLDFFWLC